MFKINKNFFAICSIGATPNISTILDFVTCMLGKGIVPLLLALSVAIFIWGVVQFSINASDEKKREEGKNFMLYGIIALTVIVSIWGFVSILTTTFKIGHVSPPIQTVVQ